MNGPFAMRFTESVGDLRAVLKHLRERQRTARNATGERLAVEQLHDQVVVPEVEERADVRMAQLRDRLRLALEASLPLRIVGELGRENLDGHRPIQPRVPRPVHLPHPARPDGGDDLVGT
jgi:hypothetical protein